MIAWSEPDADPLADIMAALGDMTALSELRPNTVIMRPSIFRRMMRRTMTKRRYRRWRGKMGEQMRAAVDERIN